jgi:hypothetical protein
MHIDDRRCHPRQFLEKPCKVYDPASRRFAPGQTRNISRGGALITVQWARPMSAGDPIDIVIAWSPRPLLPADAMVRARVARTVAVTGDVQVLALEFDHDIEAALAA